MIKARQQCIHRMICVKLVILILFFIPKFIYIIPFHSQSPYPVRLQFIRAVNEESSPSSWEILPPKRTLVAQFVSMERIEEFKLHWSSRERHLMMPLSNSSLLIGCPHLDAPAVLDRIIHFYNWTLVKVLDHSHSLTQGSLFIYKSKGGVEILFQPIVITMPRYYMAKPTQPFCAGEAWPLTYAMYSGAVFSYHFIQLPLLRKYDVYLKVDTDIEVKADFPIDIGKDIKDKGCLVGHTAIHPATDCERGSLQALKAATFYRRLTNPKSASYEWCNWDGKEDQNGLIFYGNFLAFSTQLLLHPDVLLISRFFFDDWQNGYFESRWGDQAPFPMYVCYLLDVPDLHNDSQICDYSRFRDTILIHH